MTCNKLLATTILYILSASIFQSALGQDLNAKYDSAPPAMIKVDLAKEKGKMVPIWAWFGYDEPNYTYMKDGKKLLSDLAEMSPVPVYVRAHNLLTTGDGTAM